MKNCKKWLILFLGTVLTFTFCEYWFLLLTKKLVGFDLNRDNCVSFGVLSAVASQLANRSPYSFGPDQAQGTIYGPVLVNLLTFVARVFHPKSLLLLLNSVGYGVFLLGSFLTLTCLGRSRFRKDSLAWFIFLIGTLSAFALLGDTALFVPSLHPTLVAIPLVFFSLFVLNRLNLETGFFWSVWAVIGPLLWFSYLPFFSIWLSPFFLEVLVKRRCSKSAVLSGALGLTIITLFYLVYPHAFEWMFLLPAGQVRRTFFQLIFEGNLNRFVWGCFVVYGLIFLTYKENFQSNQKLNVQAGSVGCLFLIASSIPAGLKMDGHWYNVQFALSIAQVWVAFLLAKSIYRERVWTILLLFGVIYFAAFEYRGYASIVRGSIVIPEEVDPHYGALDQLLKQCEQEKMLCYVDDFPLYYIRNKKMPPEFSANQFGVVASNSKYQKGLFEQWKLAMNRQKWGRLFLQTGPNVNSWARRSFESSAPGSPMEEIQRSYRIFKVIPHPIFPSIEITIWEKKSQF